jgi:hypothetical protein
MQSFDPDTGHKQGWIGYNTFEVLTDRLDRVFSLGRFAIEAGVDPALGADLLALGLAPGEFKRIPRIEPGIVVRDDLNHSPGWLTRGWRILLQSYGGLDIDRIPWAQKSRTKQRVAKQPQPDQPQLPPEVLGLPMAADVLADLSRLPESDQATVTLVGAYSIDAVTGESAFYLGRPSYNHGGGDAWHWKYALREDGYGGPGYGIPPSGLGDGPAGTVPDASVKLRPVAKRKSSDEANE